MFSLFQVTNDCFIPTSGVYVGWRCPDFQHDCQRVFYTSRCFCDHALSDHAKYNGDLRHFFFHSLWHSQQLLFCLQQSGHLLNLVFVVNQKVLLDFTYGCCAGREKKTRFLFVFFSELEKVFRERIIMKNYSDNLSY